MRVLRETKLKDVEYFGCHLKVDPRARYIATNGHGEVRIFTSKFRPKVHHFLWLGDGDNLIAVVNPEGMDWRDTLIDLHE